MELPEHCDANIYSLVYPSIGFFPLFDFGNGDYHGFYWPIGREAGPPLVAFTSHDARSLIPEHSSLERMYACRLARSEQEPDEPDPLCELIVETLGSAPADPGIRDVDYQDFAGLLEIDPLSPFYLCASADVRLAQNDADAAETPYRQALDCLPEYVAAHFGLASVLRRERRMDEASIHLREALIGPVAFYGGSFWADTALPGAFRNDWARKSLEWLQRSHPHETLSDDPFVRRVRELSLKPGAESRDQDFAILRTIVEDYANAGNFADAARIWRLIGEQATLETTSFRERQGLSSSTYGKRLAELLELAGNSRRAALVRNMLCAMSEPNGLYL